MSDDDDQLAMLREMLALGWPVDDEGHISSRDLGDGRTLFVDPLTFGRARLLIGPTGGYTYDDGW